MNKGKISIKIAVENVTTILEHAGIEDPLREARLLIQHATKQQYTDIVICQDRILESHEWNKILDFTKRRADFEPLAYLISEKEFWGLVFRVSTDTLIPRPDSETLIESILSNIPNDYGSFRLLDLGTGSGCLLGALLQELPNSSGLGIERNPNAASIAEFNMQKLGFKKRSEIRVGDWGKGIDENFDFVICNPPYVASREISELSIDVKDYEPMYAIDGGIDGLVAYRTIAPQLAKLLKYKGLAAFECGYGQATLIVDILKSNSLNIKSIETDLSSIDRCLLATV